MGASVPWAICPDRPGFRMIPLSAEVSAASHGGKAAQLSVARRAGLPVPDGFALSVQWVEDLVSGASSATELCEHLLSSLGGRPVAVRSSAADEDGAGASFAGLHVTQLGVASAASLQSALRAVWQSARSESALAYRARLGLDPTPRIAAVVQLMVNADCAGVLFTRDPRTGQEVRIVESAWGLGEAIVSGIVDPDRYRFERGGNVLERAAGDKDVAVRLSSDGSTQEQAVADNLRTVHTLSDEQLRALDALATRCDAVYGSSAHDIEFAWENGELFLLQRRPVTR